MTLSSRSKRHLSGGDRRRGISLQRESLVSLDDLDSEGRPPQRHASLRRGSGDATDVPGRRVRTGDGTTGAEADGESATAWVDDQTLHDLDVFPNDRSETSLLQLFDRTRTTGGHDVLWRFLAAPLRDAGAIRDRQEAIRYFAASESNRTRWTPRTTDRGTIYIERYLDSYVHPIRGTRGPTYWARALWYRTSYRKYYEYLDSGIRALHRFLRSLEEVVARVERPLPDEIESCLTALETLLRDERTKDFLRRGGRHSRFRTATMFHFDDLFRGEMREVLLAGIRAVYRLDAYVSVGKTMADLGLTLPEVVVGAPQPEISARGLYHPLLAAPVQNDIDLRGDQGFLFLTGPNMAGKTTLMKALGIAVYLAQIGFPVPCAALRITPFDGIYSSLHVEDNLGKGYSYFFAEVRRVKAVAEALAAERRLLVLFDELFKGTNLKDALDASRLVVEGFLRHADSLFVLSSHLLELGEELVTRGQSGTSVSRDALAHRIRFLCFDAEVVERRPRFPYRLREGLSQERLGMLILENEGIPDLLAGRRDAGVSRRATVRALRDDQRSDLPNGSAGLEPGSGGGRQR